MFTLPRLAQGVHPIPVDEPGDHLGIDRRIDLDRLAAVGQRTHQGDEVFPVAGEQDG